MANPLVEQGTLNRLRASIVWPNFPSLNVTPSYLGKDMISVDLDGEATTMLPTATGVVTSPEPYQMVTVTIHLLRTQGLAEQYKSQKESSTLLGPCVVRPDTTALSPYDFRNCAIKNVETLKFDGQDAGYVVTIQGYYLINSSLWDA